MPIQISIAALLAVLVAAVAVAVYVVQGERQRRQTVERVAGNSGVSGSVPVILIKGGQSSLQTRVAGWLRAQIPTSLVGGAQTETTLLHAGFDSEFAPAVYAGTRIACMVLLPLLAFVFAPRANGTHFMLAVTTAVVFGAFAPPGILARWARMRQEQLRRSIPDALDLLVVCVEAGVSLDAAVLRVAREVENVHPDLANEFYTVNRRINAGMSREEALRGLWIRTGVQELRALSASMIQSEQWGTSISKVLRVFAEGLRRKRKQNAEKRAALAATKMIFPLGLFILPALFIVILGPVIINVTRIFGGMTD